MSWGPKNTNKCLIPLCEKRGTSKGYCQYHYQQWYRSNPINKEKSRLASLICKHNDIEKTREQTRKSSAKQYADPITGPRIRARSLARHHNTMHRSWKHERKEIQQLYETAFKLGLSVDHIIPLTHTLVCGLHCLANLQLMPIKENITKGNKYDLD